MQNGHYKNLLYFISFVILVTLTIQVYWNYRNFKAGRQQLLNEVQASLDNAIDSYFVDLARKEADGFGSIGDGKMIRNPELDILLNEIIVSDRNDKSAELIYHDTFVEVNSQISRFDTVFKSRNPSDMAQAQEEILNFFDSIEINSFSNLKNLTSRIVVSITTDSVNIKQLDSYIQEEFSRKDLNVPFGYIFTNQKGKIQTSNMEELDVSDSSTLASSAYLPKDSRLQLFFTNANTAVLEKNLVGLLLSALLIGSVIACLFHLLNIINRQKQLAEVKNDLISNITHEFKTPISTAKVALEGIQNFNKGNDPAKTRNYLHISNTQLDKLQLMVEKLLETATLDGNNLHLKLEEVPIMPMVSELVEKYGNLAKHKTFRFIAEQQKILVFADPFHLENALNNILDNAIKYGGSNIEVEVSADNQVVKINISDNGTCLTTAQTEQVFEKFYRVPKGNTHNVKGFGIGLYYTKSIIEKHGGSIKLHLNDQTNFIITLPRND